MIIQFKKKAAETIQIGDLMRETDEEKWQTYHSYYRAVSIKVGELATPIHSPMDGSYLGDRLTDGVEIEWLCLADNKIHTRRFARNYPFEVAAEAVDDLNKLIKIEEHEEAIV